MREREREREGERERERERKREIERKKERKKERERGRQKKRDVSLCLKELVIYSISDFCNFYRIEPFSKGELKFLRTWRLADSERSDKKVKKTKFLTK